MRLETADRLKCLCILLMIVGHCQISAGLHDFIYLFHIPMFFFLSGYFFKNVEFIDGIKRDSRRLLVPYIAGIVLVAVKYGIDAFRLNDFSSLSQYWLSAFVVGPSISFSSWAELDIGPIWFLVSLFWCKVFFNGLLKYKYGSWVAIGMGLSLASLVPEIYLPFGMQQGALGMFFYGMGHQFAKNEKVRFSIWLWPISLLTSLVTIVLPAIDMHQGVFPIPVLNCIVSLASVLFLWKLFFIAERYKGFFFKCLSYCGRNSLLILIVHYYEAMTFDFHKNLPFMSEPEIIVVRLVCDIVVAILLSRIPLVRKLFCLK